MSSTKGRYEVFVGEDGKHYFNKIAGNGEVEHPSQGYASKGGAIAAIGRCMEDSSHYAITERSPKETSSAISSYDWRNELKDVEDTGEIQKDVRDY